MNYTVEIIGGSDEQRNIILDINGDRKTLWEGYMMITRNGDKLEVVDLFITTIPTLSASSYIRFWNQDSEVRIE